jgi:hypothetical protein
VSRECETRTWLTGPKVDARFGITARTRRRWETDPKLVFPRAVVINNKKYYRLAEIEDFEQRQAARGITEAREAEAA